MNGRKWAVGYRIQFPGEARWRPLLDDLELWRRMDDAEAAALAAEYADQAHFCRDFGDIGGMTPGEYRARVGPVPGLIFSP